MQLSTGFLVVKQTNILVDSQCPRCCKDRSDSSVHVDCRTARDVKSVRTSTGSANEQVATVAGPCNNYDSLVTLSQFSGLTKFDLEDVKTADALATKWKGIK